MISVIMAEFNTPPAHLRKAIQSILDQTFRDFEFIIVDDGGSNDVQTIAAEFDDSRIVVIENGENKGFVASLNIAIERAKGKFLARMDTDDFVSTERFEVLHSFMVQNPQYAVVSSRAFEFTGCEEPVVIGAEGEKTSREVLRGDVPVHAASMMNRMAVVDVGGYKDFRRAEDFALWCDLLLAGSRLYSLPDVLYWYRVDHKDYAKRTLRHRGGDIRARLHYYPLLHARPSDYTKIVRTIIGGLLPGYLARKLRHLELQHRKRRAP